MNKKSGHWQNTGLAKWISDNLYQYNTSDEKSMNPMKWYSIQNGGNLNDTRETINGFPCRLILINDGETPLNEGQNEPTPGNVKDMGIFKFNNDKGNTDTFGLDNKIFPRCVSYEVVANSDTSAGAFVPFTKTAFVAVNGYNTQYEATTGYIPLSEFGLEIGKPFIVEGSGFVADDGTVNIQLRDVNKNWIRNIYPRNTVINVDDTNIGYLKLSFGKGTNVTEDTMFKVGDCIVKPLLDGTSMQGTTLIIDNSLELKYLQDSFELRYPDDKEVGADYGMLGMDIDNSGTLNSEYGLKRVIDWVGNATDEEFVANFEQYFNKEYTFRYYLLVIALG